MNCIEISVVINAPREQVFTVLADLPLLGRIHPNVVKIYYTSEISKGVGVTSHWIAKKPGRPEFEFDEEFTSWEENRRMGFITTSGPKMSGELLVEDQNNGTLLTFWEKLHDGDYPDPDAKRASMMAQLLGIKEYLEKK